MVVEVQGDLAATGLYGDFEVVPQGHGSGGAWRCQLQGSDPSDARYFLQLLCFGCAVDLVIRASVRRGILIDMRIDFDPQAMDATAFYRLLTAVVVPRPIAWVFTVSSADSSVTNLAPATF